MTRKTITVKLPRVYLDIMSDMIENGKAESRSQLVRKALNNLIEEEKVLIDKMLARKYLTCNDGSDRVKAGDAGKRNGD